MAARVEVEAGWRYDVDIVRGIGGLDAMLACDYRRTRAVAMGLVECLCWEWTASVRGRSTRAAQATGNGGERVEVEVANAIVPLYRRPRCRR
jgi:hypothetical protein